MTTSADLVADARRITYGSMTEQINLVGAPAAANATSVILDLDVSGITPGMVLSCGLNVWYVPGTTTSTIEVFLIPGYDNSPKDAVSVGDIVTVKPKVTDWYLFNIINDELRKLSSPTSGLYRIGSWSVNVSPTYH